MTIKEVFELIHRNGSGKDIMCSFSSEDYINDTELISTINNYKYKDGDGTINIYVDRLNFEKHKTNLATRPHCKLFIYKREQKKESKDPVITVELSCKFFNTLPEHIIVRILSIKYVDDGGNEVSKKMMPMNEKKVELS
ncbi:MAG: hypothetical protein WC603_00510 [Candidatus Paceibacterota bacterium]|jgi:hypothetical protein